MTALVEAKEVHKVYETGRIRVHALKGVNLTIQRGEMVSIMGPSGCGKTTLLNCFSGLDDITSGVVKIDGVSLSGMSDDAKTDYRARNMGFIFQSYNLLPILTSLENIELPLLVAGSPPREARRRAEEVLEAVGLKGWADHKPAELSAGQQQRVAIARSLVNTPLIVWADELTGNLDTETSIQIMKLLQDLNTRNNQTFVVVTHDPAVANMTHRVLRMRSGRIIEEYRPTTS